MGERTGPDGTTQELVYDQLSRHVLQETTGAQQRDYVMDVARDRILAIDSAIGDDVYVYQNFRGDVRAVTSTTSAIKDVRNYLPTGVAISYAATNFPEMRYGYQGKEQQITGLQDFVNRAYDPYTGRATSFDPLRTAAGAYGNHSGLGWQDYPLVTPGSQTQRDPEGLLWAAFVGYRNAVEYQLSTKFDINSGTTFTTVQDPSKGKVGITAVVHVPENGGGCTTVQRTRIAAAGHDIANAIGGGCLGAAANKSRLLAAMRYALSYSLL